MAAVVDVSGLRKEYGRTVAVADVSFTVEPGEIFGLLGPNGSGKTTTVECLQGLRRADAGSVRVFGLDPATEAMKLRRLVGSQLQDSALPDRLRVGEALELFAAISPGGPPWRRLLEEWGLADQVRTAFGNLSGGQRQRLFVALALVSDPRLVVLDEMTTGLDPAARRVAWDLVSAVRDRARPSSSSPTSWTRRNGCATGSPCCRVAACWPRVRPPSSLPHSNPRGSCASPRRPLLTCPS
jgi:ABC-2 type transport system ATP-binding protein